MFSVNLTKSIIISMRGMVVVLCANSAAVFSAGKSVAIEKLPAVNVDRAFDLRMLDGRWDDRVQIMWDPQKRRAVRRNYQIWDPFGDTGLDLRWTPDDLILDRERRVSGRGRVTWRQSGTASHDASAVLAEYVGDMSDGMANGLGHLHHRSGLEYEGTWLAGKMHGTGRLFFPNGDQYVGGFKEGARHGRGVFIDAAGEVYEGGFREDVRDGEGTVFPLHKVAYRALWQRGSEMAGSRIPLLADEPLPEFSRIQTTVTDLVRLGVSVDRRYVFDRKETLPYQSNSTGEALSIYPDDPRLLDVWRARAEIQMNDQEASSSPNFPSFLNNPSSRFQPVPIIFDLTNATSQPLGIIGAYLQVVRSDVDAEPAVHLSVSKGDGCSEGMGFQPNLSFENFGWAKAMSARLRFTFAAPGVESEKQQNINKKQPHLKELGTIDDTAESDLTENLDKDGVDTKALKEAPIYCPSRNAEECLEKAKTTGVFGTLANQVSVQGSLFIMPTAGTLEYDWVDPVRKATVKKISNFHTEISIGSLVFNNECGEGGEPGILRPRPYTLSLDRSNYRISLPLSENIPAGVVARWRILLDAEKSSNHHFKIVVRLAGGREMISRDIKLLYFKPREILKEDADEN